MAGTSGCSGQLKELELSDSCGVMGGSEESDFVTAPASEASHATQSSLFLSTWSDSVLEREKKKTSGECSSDSESVQERIERSKSHWSTLADQSGCVEGEEVAEVSNVEVFTALQLHPVWGRFFQTFGYDLQGGKYQSMGELVVGEKFAEGAQAELYDAQVTSWNPEDNERAVRAGHKYVLKIFKKGTFLKHLQSQVPQGFLKISVEMMENWASSHKLLPKLSSMIYRGTLLKDGRFAFLLEKEHCDLRSLIERTMQSRSGEDCGPFSKDEAEVMMYDVALGVNWLHSHDIVHRDLKASNVLVWEYKSGSPKYGCYVADYECSVGVVGTGFFRAPEVLQACKDGKASSRLEVFSRAADVYSYGMTCYEILTGKLPFENHPLSDNKHLLIDCVINQHLRPKIHEYVEDWACKLLRMCWQFDPMKRPSIEEILNLLSNNSIKVKEHEEFLTGVYGQDFKQLV